MTTETAIEVKRDEWQEYASERKEKASLMIRMCDVIGMPRPAPFTEEERVFLSLTQRYVDLAEEIAENRIDRTMLPALLEETAEANVPREGLLRERVRHGANYVGGGVTSAVSGFFTGALVAALEAMVWALDRAAVVLVPFTFTFLVSCIVMTIQANQAQRAFDGELIRYILFYSFWLSALVGVFSGTLWAAWTAYQRRRMERQVERQRLRQVPQKVEVD